MGASSYIVKAKEPTVLAGQTYYDLLGIDLMLGFKVDTAHVVPGPIDVKRFDDALARTLSVYPVLAGHVRRARESGEPWKIALTNDGVPVTIVDSDSDCSFSRNSVVQTEWNLTRGVDVVKYLDYESEEPLMTVMLTRFKNGYTSIGLCTTHLLCDGYVQLQLLRLLSQNYQGLEPLDAPPCYDIIPPYPVTRDFGEIELPDLRNTYRFREGAPHADPKRKRPLRVDVRLTTGQIKQLHGGILALGPTPCPVRLSRQDSMVALLAYCISKVQPDIPPIQHITTLLMNRGIAPRPAQSVGNRLIWAETKAVEDFDAETPYTIAVRIREAIEWCKDPEFSAAYDEIHAVRALETANAEIGQDFLQPPEYMVVNSTWRFDWTSAHFGYPGRARFFHTVLDGPRYVKFFEPNPVLQQDGTWKSRRGDVEITLHVDDYAHAQFKKMILEELRRLGVAGDIELF